MSENPMLEQATKLNYPVDGTKIKFQGIADLKDNTVAIESVEPLSAAPQAATPDGAKTDADAETQGNGEMTANNTENGAAVPEDGANGEGLVKPEDKTATGMTPEEAVAREAANKMVSTGFGAAFANKTANNEAKANNLAELEAKKSQEISTRLQNSTKDGRISDTGEFFLNKGGGKTKKRRRRKYRGSAKRRKSGKCV